MSPMLGPWSYRRVHRNANDANDDPLDRPKDVVVLREVTYEEYTRSRGKDQPCPVEWCDAEPGEPCWDERLDVEVPMHSPRRALVGSA